MKSRRLLVVPAKKTSTDNEKSEQATVKRAALGFLCKANQSTRDAARGKQMLMFREYLDHAQCNDIDCATCICLMGSGLRMLQWVQNDAFGTGVFCPSDDVRIQRMKRAKEWTKAMKVPPSHKDFKGLPEWLQQEIIQYIEARAPQAKPVQRVSIERAQPQPSKKELA
jgi:hypothetical protein